MFILYPTTVLKVTTKEGEEKIIPPTYYGKFSTGNYYILYDKDMIANKDMARVSAISYTDIALGAPFENVHLYFINEFKEKFEFKDVDIIDTYYIRDVGTSKEFYVGDKIRGFKSGSNIYCPRKVIFYSVDFESYDNTGSTKITFIEDSGSEKLTRITLSNPEYSYNKLMKNGHCPFYSDYYIEPTNSSLFGGIF